MGLAYFLEVAKFPMGLLSRYLLAAVLQRIAVERMVTYCGKVIVVIDPTEYQKRSSGKGKKGRHMEHVGRVRKRNSKTRKKAKASKDGKRRKGKAKKPETTRGYVDVWAGLVLKGKEFLPLARQLFSNNSQNRVEEAVLFQALALVKRAKLAAIVVGDRGLGRKELLIRLARAGQDLVMRLDADINVRPDGATAEMKLAMLLSQQPWLGELDWDSGGEGKLRCRVRSVTATIRFSRSGRKDDYQEARLNFVELVPMEGNVDPLVLATTLPSSTLMAAKGVAGVYAQRWAIETGFETMKAWGLGRFMVRKWKAIERLLWAVAVAYGLIALLMQEAQLRGFREQAIRVIKKMGIFGKRLTFGKLAEAITLDYQHHQRAWTAVWLS